MAGQIRITPEQLRAEAGKLTSLANEHDSIFRKIV